MLDIPDGKHLFTPVPAFHIGPMELRPRTIYRAGSCWPHATDSKPAHRIKTDMRMRFISSLLKTNLSDGNLFPGKFGSFTSEGAVSHTADGSAGRRTQRCLLPLDN